MRDAFEFRREQSATMSSLHMSPTEDVSIFMLGAALLLTALFVFIATRRPVPSGLPRRELRAVPGINPDLRSKLKASGATLYGASWCGYTQKQLEVLGCDESNTSDSGVKYVACERPENEEVCKAAGVDAFPTWHLSGQMYPGYMDLERLQSLLK